jgi:hypothetical protein
MNPRLNFRNPKLRYQTSHAGGMRANPPYGLITGIPAEINTKYIPGTGVGSSSIFTRRAKLRRSVVCSSGCGKFIYPLDQPNYNVNGRGYELLAYNLKLFK